VSDNWLLMYGKKSLNPAYFDASHSIRGRQKAGWSQADLAKRANITLGIVQRIEAREFRNVPYSLRDAIIDAFERAGVHLYRMKVIPTLLVETPDGIVKRRKRLKGIPPQRGGA
jgi:transcriptional regulator with XRE-family HTH domain